MSVLSLNDKLLLMIKQIIRCYYQQNKNSQFEQYTDMIVSQTTRVYTNNKGEQEKVDVLRSYRKVGVAKTNINETNDNGASLLTISVKAILILAIVYGIISLIIPLFIAISTTNQVLYQKRAKECSINQLQLFLKLHQTRYTLNQYQLQDNCLTTQLQQSKTTKLQRQLLDSLECWWQNNRILCEIKQIKPGSSYHK